MIDKNTFAEAMSVLADRFNRPLHSATQRRYFEILSEDLTTEEFSTACELAFRSVRFWPSPQELLELVKPEKNLDLEAAGMFEAVRDLGFPHQAGMCWHREEVAALGAPALAGFVAIGAQERLRHLSADDLSWARREFVAAYKAKATETKADKQIEAARAAIRAPQRSRAALKPGPQTPHPGAVLVGEVVAKVVREMSPAAIPAESGRWPGNTP